MSFERLWASTTKLFISNGTARGTFQVSDYTGLYVKQLVSLASSSQQPLQVQIKRIESNGTIYVGGVTNDITHRIDISQYLVSDSATVFAPEQTKTHLKKEDQDQASYEAEPVNARRVLGVDARGNAWSPTNPLPTTATISGDITIGTDGYDLINPDSMNITGSEDGTKTGIKHSARVDSELDLRVGISDGANKATVNIGGELAVIDQPVRDKLDNIVSSLAGTLNVSDSAAQSLLTTIIAGLVSIDAGIPAALGQNSMANSMPVTLASNQSPIPVVASLGDEPIKISGTIDGTPSGTEYTFVNNRVSQILAAKDSRFGTITYADFGTKDQRVTSITYTAPSIGSGAGFTAVKTFTYTLVGIRYRRDTPGNWTII